MVVGHLWLLEARDSNLVPGHKLLLSFGENLLNHCCVLHHHEAQATGSSLQLSIRIAEGLHLRVRHQDLVDLTIVREVGTEHLARPETQLVDPSGDENALGILFAELGEVGTQSIAGLLLGAFWVSGLACLPHGGLPLRLLCAGILAVGSLHGCCFIFVRSLLCKRSLQLIAQLSGEGGLPLLPGCYHMRGNGATGEHLRKGQAAGRHRELFNLLLALLLECPQALLRPLCQGGGVHGLLSCEVVQLVRLHGDSAQLLEDCRQLTADIHLRCWRGGAGGPGGALVAPHLGCVVTLQVRTACSWIVWSACCGGHCRNLLQVEGILALVIGFF
mmetsp:Transcript_15764/g.37041  ORF Transcript_15764/g.37041 Transcript_15764/m.37041 type:complete len:331 (+) Transcript_15764:497-1489(+)